MGVTFHRFNKIHINEEFKDICVELEEKRRGEIVTIEQL